MQFNAIYTRSGYSRPSEERAQREEERRQEEEGQKQQQQQQQEQEEQQQQKPYLRCSTLSPAPLWIINSLHPHLQSQIMFRLGLGLRV